MHDVRESAFQCQFHSVSSRRVAYVRAWDAEEALQVFVEELRADGFDEAGEVVIAPARGGGATRAHLQVRGAA